MTNPANKAFFDKIIVNDVQREAVEHNDGPQLVFAGAGTGKTRVLTAKIAWLIRCGGYAPTQIFAATFTNKAAREMKSRVEALLDMPCGGLWIGTFHSLCVRILRRESTLLGYRSGFTIYDADDQKSLVKKVLNELEIDEKTMAPSLVLHAISRCKNRCQTPDQAAAVASGFYDQQLARVYRSYQEALARAQAMDFDDLIGNVVTLFATHPHRLEHYRERFGYILVDEYQDTNFTQFSLIKQLCGQTGHIFVVGDDDQSIYGWRGAEVANILSFEKHFEGTRVFKLEQNYRSTQAILDFANAAISSNINRSSKKLWTSRSGGTPVRLLRYPDDRAEADGIAEAVNLRLREENAKPSDILVLYRTNAQSRAFEDAFRKRKIPYALVGGTSFYQRKEIKDSLAFLKLIVNPDDSISFDRIANVPPRGIGKKAFEQLEQGARAAGLSHLNYLHKKGTGVFAGKARSGFDSLLGIFDNLTNLTAAGERPEQLLTEALRATGYADALEGEETDESSNRLDNISELLNGLAIWERDNPQGTLGDFLEEITLASDIDTLEKGESAVVLMTLHSAKGLEAPFVYLAGLEDGIIPSRQNFDDPDKIEEERRLFYVGITRAMKELIGTFVDNRWRFGSLLPMEPTRFLHKLPSTLFELSDMNTRFVAPPPRIERAPAPSVRTGTMGALRRGGAVVKGSAIGTGRASTPAAPAATPVPRKPPAPQYDEFSQDTVQLRMGQHVRHATYGIGRILSISGFGSDTRLTVLFNDGSRKKMMAQFANLEIL